MALLRRVGERHHALRRSSDSSQQSAPVLEDVTGSSAGTSDTMLNAIRPSVGPCRLAVDVTVISPLKDDRARYEEGCAEVLFSASN